MRNKKIYKWIFKKEIIKYLTKENKSNLIQNYAWKLFNSKKWENVLGVYIMYKCKILNIKC